MEPLFENRFIWTKKALREMSYRAFRPGLVALAVIVALLWLSVLFLSLIIGTPFRELLSPPLFALIGIYAVYALLPLLQADMTYRRTSQLYGGAPDVTVQFFDDHFIDQTRQTGAELNLSYSQIKRILETDSLLLLKLSSRFFIMIDKNGFTRGDAATLKAFLQQKTNAR